MAKVWVKGFTKSDGTKVKGHYRDGSKRPPGVTKEEWAAEKYYEKRFQRSKGKPAKIRI